jgi:uroporphyrin-3 C-methyltransferase
VLLLVLGAAGVGLWRNWPGGQADATPELDLSPQALDARLLAAEQSLQRLQREKDALQQRLTDTSARTSLLRDEMLGVTQRSALIEDSVRELADQQRSARQSLRLDEAELLLSIAQERWQLQGDVAGAVRATELADGVLASLKGPQWLNLRQTLAQELGALRALPADPRAQAAGELDALEALLPQLPAGNRRDTRGNPERSSAQRLLDALVQVRPSGEEDLLAPAERSAGSAALALDIALARLALERRDTAAFRGALRRIDGWLRRLHADTAPLRQRRARLEKLQALALKVELPVAGSTLSELRTLQRREVEAP